MSADVVDDMQAAEDMAASLAHELRAEDLGPQCDTCGDIGSGARPGEPCGRDMSEEHDEPAGTTICAGTYKE